VGLIENWADFFWLLDQGRRLEGDALGGMVHCPWTAPAKPALRRPGFTLWDYGGVGGGGGRPFLLVPAPIKRPYIWDLSPEVSVVRTTSEAHAPRWRPFLIDWAPPDGQLPADTDLEAMVLMVTEAARSVASLTGHPPVVAGHSLGGTLTALAAALAPEGMAGLVLIEAPTAFGKRAGAFAPLVAASGDAGRVAALLGGAPGSFLNMAAMMADHHAFVVQPFWDWMACLPDPEGLLLHLKLRRWSLDEAPLPQPLFEDVVELLYHRDLFLRGQLRLGGQRLNPALPHPLMTVYDPRSRTVPPSSLMPLHDMNPHRLTRRTAWEWEPGVLFHHLAPVVGRKAHKELWPLILGWGGEVVG